MANELYKNGDTKTALIYFEKARAVSQAYHRADVVAVAACYANAGDKATAFSLLKTAIDKGRRLDWFENVYYFDKMKNDAEWQGLVNYKPKMRETRKYAAYHDLIHGIMHEMEDIFKEMEKTPAAAARMPVLDSTAALLMTETINTLGLPNEGELDDEDIQEFLGLYIKIGTYNNKMYQFLLAHAATMVGTGVFRAKEYAAMVDTWNSHWGQQTAAEGDTVLPIFGNDHTNIATFTPEQLEQITSNRISIGLLPFGMDISAVSQKKVDTIAEKICKPTKK
jgi:tetratricopeptide (TPR) repeat protein